VRRAILAVGLVLVMSSCGRSHSVERHPDVEGIVTAVDLHHVEVDGRSYPVSPRLRSFAAGTLQTVPLLWRAGQYVQLGLSGRTVLWIEGIGAVVQAPGRPPTVYFTEVLRRTRGDRAVFRDGTVLRLGPVHPPARLPARVQVEIDPALHAVRRLTAIPGS
jgi:hypothetical protein